jgi:outer membrane protein assembly factor BamB
MTASARPGTGVRGGMARRHWRAVAAAAAAALALAGIAPAAAAPSRHAHAPPPPPQSAADWTSFLHDTGHSSYNAAATSITPSNIGSLQPVWRWLVPAASNGGYTGFLASPIVSDGVVYIGADDGYFYAIDEATQQVLWSDYLGLVTPTTCRGPLGIVSTATIADDPATGDPTVYVDAPDGYFYALDAATGTVVWQSVVHIPSTTKNDYFAWGSPLVTNGNVYIGISSNCDNPLVPAGLLAFNQSTGAQVAQWNSLPPKQDGASVWSTPALTAGGRIITATGNGYNSSGEPLYDDSIVALDPNTLGVLDSWQIPASQQIPDADFGGSPTMFTATIDGVSTPMVGICNKNGLYYALQQDDLAAGPVWQTRITDPYPGGAKECDAAAIWDGTNLIEGGGAQTTIDGTVYQGSVQSLDPATGTPLWQTGLPGTIVGSPTEDGAGVVAAVTYQSSTHQVGVYLLSAATGAVLDDIPEPGARLFGQAIFAQNDLLVGAGPDQGLTAYEVTTAGPPITGVSPAVIGRNTSGTLQLTGSGFSGSPTVSISGAGVTAGTPTVVSSTQLDVPVTVSSSASQTARDITVIEPGSPATADTCTGCLTIGRPLPASLSPNSFAAGRAHQASTVNGTNFDPGAVVRSQAGITVQTTFESSTALGVSVTVRSTVAPGNYNVWVKNPDGSSGECAGCLTVTASG